MLLKSERSTLYADWFPNRQPNYVLAWQDEPQQLIQECDPDGITGLTEEEAIDVDIC